MSMDEENTREVIVIDEHHGKALLRRLRVVDPWKDKFKHRQSIATIVIPDATLKACDIADKADEKAKSETQEPPPEPPRVA